LKPDSLVKKFASAVTIPGVSPPKMLGRYVDIMVGEFSATTDRPLVLRSSISHSGQVTALPICAHLDTVRAGRGSGSPLCKRCGANNGNVCTL
jgi:hypothetical protein